MKITSLHKKHSIFLKCIELIIKNKFTYILNYTLQTRGVLISWQIKSLIKETLKSELIQV